MTRFVLQRLIRSVVTLLIVLTAVFIVLRMSGDPAVNQLGPDATPEALQAFRVRNGLDKPLFVQYFIYLKDLASGNLGDSMKYGVPVMDLFSQRIPATLQLGAVTMVLALLVGIPAGILAANRHNAFLDRFTMFFAFIAHSAPGFFVGIMLILLLSLRWHLLPSSGQGSWKNFIMPALTSAAGLTAALARMTRASLLEVSHADYIRTARAKGLHKNSIIYGHMLRNAMLPVVTMFGLWLSGIIGGAAITETVFAWPGVGRLIVEAVAGRDYPVVQSVVLLVAVCVILVNFLVDVAYGWLDPRISVTGGAK